MSYRQKALGGLVFGLFAAAPMLAAQVDIPNTFSSGETASASAVNENFQALVTAIDGLNTRVTKIEDSDLDTRLSTLEDSELVARENFVVSLDQYLDVHTTSPADTAVKGPILRLTGANLQIINAAQNQNTPDGTGNLVVGFAKARNSVVAADKKVCSIGSQEDQLNCEFIGGVWATAHNSGSHNIVGGTHPAYSRTGGMVLGKANAITAENAIALAGRRNLARGGESAVLTGLDSVASGEYAAVGAGRGNEASGQFSFAGGGHFNNASGLSSAVLGGGDNTASAVQATVSGGQGCDVALDFSWGATRADGTTTEGDC